MGKKSKIEAEHASTQPLLKNTTIIDLALTYPENLSSTVGAYTPCSWLLVLHGNLLWVLDFHLLAALHAVCLHRPPPMFCTKDKSFITWLSIGGWVCDPNGVRVISFNCR